MRYTPVRWTPVRCTPVKCIPMRCTSVRCTPMRCTPVRYTMISKGGCDVPPHALVRHTRIVYPSDKLSNCVARYIPLAERSLSNSLRHGDGPTNSNLLFLLFQM